MKIEILALRDLIKYGMPDCIIQVGGGIGDELLLSAVARELKKRNAKLKIWQISHSADLLLNNGDYDCAYAFGKSS